MKTLTPWAQQQTYCMSPRLLVFLPAREESFHPTLGRRKASAGAGRRAGAGRETRRRERDPAPGKRESSQPGAGKEESFHREKKNLSKEEIVTCWWQEIKPFSQHLERSNVKTFSGPHTRTTTWSMNIVYICILLSLPRCLLCPLLSGTMSKTSWFIASSKTPADDDGLMTPKRCVHHHLPCTVRGLFSFYTFQKSWN